MNYRFRMHAPVRFGAHSAPEMQKAVEPRRLKPRVTKIGFYSFAAAEEKAERKAAPARPSNGWESTARLLRVLASAGCAPRVGHA